MNRDDGYTLHSQDAHYSCRATRPLLPPPTPHQQQNTLARQFKKHNTRDVEQSHLHMTVSRPFLSAQTMLSSHASQVTGSTPSHDQKRPVNQIRGYHGPWAPSRVCFSQLSTCSPHVHHACILNSQASVRSKLAPPVHSTWVQTHVQTYSAVSAAIDSNSFPCLRLSDLQKLIV